MTVKNRTCCDEPGCDVAVEADDANLADGWWRFQVVVSVPMWGARAGNVPAGGAFHHACPAHHSTVAMRIMADLERLLADAQAERTRVSGPVCTCSLLRMPVGERHANEHDAECLMRTRVSTPSPKGEP